MIQDIASHTYDPTFRKKVPEEQDFVLCYEYNEVMLLRQGEGYAIPTFRDLLNEEDVRPETRHLFCIDDRAYYLVTDMKVPEFGGYVMEGLPVFRTFEPLYQAFAGITDSQLCRWFRNRKYCGGCGQKIASSEKKRAMVCSGRGQTEYPKISPAIIVAIKNKDKLLMSRYAKGTYRDYALTAGFVEIGETFEDCVRRGVMEEVGLKVENIRYCRGQPWAFSDTEMIGFTAELDGGDTIRLEEDELPETGWLTRDEIAEYGPYISVGHEMMKAFRDGKTQWNGRNGWIVRFIYYLIWTEH